MLALQMSLGKYFDQKAKNSELRTMFEFGPFKNKDKSSDINDLMRETQKDLDFENKCKSLLSYENSIHSRQIQS